MVTVSSFLQNDHHPYFVVTTKQMALWLLENIDLVTLAIVVALWVVFTDLDANSERSRCCVMALMWSASPTWLIMTAKCGPRKKTLFF